MNKISCLGIGTGVGDIEEWRAEVYEIQISEN